MNPPSPVEDMDLARVHAVVAPVSDVDIAGVIHSDLHRKVHLTALRASLTKLHEPLAVGRELLHPVVPVVGHVHRAVALVNGDAPRGVELTVALSQRAPAGDELTVSGELADFVAAAVGQVQVAVGVDRQAGGAVLLAVVGRNRAPPLDEGAVLLELRHHVHPFVGHVDVSVRGENHAGGPDELAFPGRRTCRTRR